MSRVLLRGGNVFDGSGSDPVAADVLIEGNTILAVGNDLPAAETVHDVTGLTLTPGFINTHVHVVGCSPKVEEQLKSPFSYQFFQALPILDSLLSSGITYARDLAGADAGVQLALKDGTIEGPTLQIAIEALSTTGGHIDAWAPSGMELFEYYIPHPARPHGVVDGPDEIRAVIRKIIRGGANVIKICTTDGGVWPRLDKLPAHFRDDELAVVMAEARNANLPVAAHAMGVQGVKNAIRAGVQSIEHGTHLDQEAVDMMVERGTWLVPTLVRFLGILDNPEVAARVGPLKIDNALRVAEVAQRSFSMAVESGVRVAFGTDMHGGDFLDDLMYMNRLGLSGSATLVSATSGAAELMRIDDTVGYIRPGWQADIVALSGDPYDFTRLRERVSAVIQRGTVVRGGFPANHRSEETA